MLPMDVTTDTEPSKASTGNVVVSDAVVSGPTASPEQASFKLDTAAAADDVAIPTPALHDRASAPQGVGGKGMQTTPTSCTEKSTDTMETDPETLHRGTSAEGKLFVLGETLVLPSFASGSRRAFVGLVPSLLWH